MQGILSKSPHPPVHDAPGSLVCFGYPLVGTRFRSLCKKYRLNGMISDAWLSRPTSDSSSFLLVCPFALINASKIGRPCCILVLWQCHRECTAIDLPTKHRLGFCMSAFGSLALTSPSRLRRGMGSASPACGLVVTWTARGGASASRLQVVGCVQQHLD